MKKPSYQQLLKDVQALGACSLLALAGAPALAQQSTQSVESEEEIVVTGIRKSLADAAALKRDASQIVDAISAEEIGKLSDTNIAEAIQRVSGITIGRDDAGDGSTFQIRGFSGNSLTINGKSVVTDGFDQRTNNLNAFSSGIVKNIIVKKSQSADDIEGGIGGSVDIQLLSPLDFDEAQIKLSGELIDNSVESNPSAKYQGLATKKWEFSNGGQLGILLQAENENKNVISQQYEGRTGGVNRAGGRPISTLLRQGAFGVDRGDGVFEEDGPVFFQRQATFDGKEIEIDRTSLTGTIAFRPIEDLTFNLQGVFTDREQLTNQARNTINVQGGNQRVIPGTEAFDRRTRNASIFDFDASQIGNDDNGDPINPDVAPVISDGIANDRYFTGVPQLDGEIPYYFLTRGTFQNRNPTFSPYGFNSRYNINDRESTELSFDVEWNITDSFTVKGAYGSSESSTDNTQYQINTNLIANHPTRTVTKTGPNGGNVNIPNKISPSLRYDISSQDPDRIPDYELVWLDYDEDTETSSPTPGFENFSLTSRDTLYNSLRLGNLGRSFNRTRGEEEALTLDFDWEVDMPFISEVEFGTRIQNLTTFKDRSDFVRFALDGEPIRGNGLNNLPDFINNTPVFNTGFRTFQEIIDGGLIEFNSTDRTSSLTEEQVDSFFEVRNAIPDIDGNFPREYWAGGSSQTEWENMMHAIYGPNENRLNELQTEKLEEESEAFYVKFNFETEVKNVPITGNFGVRYVKNEVNSQAYIDHCNVPWELAEDQTSYNGTESRRSAALSDVPGRNRFLPELESRDAALLNAVRGQQGMGDAISFDPTRPELFNTPAEDDEGNLVLDDNGDQIMVFPTEVYDAWQARWNSLRRMSCSRSIPSEANLTNDNAGRAGIISNGRQIPLLDGRATINNRIPIYYNENPFVASLERDDVILTQTTGTETSLPGQFFTKDYVESLSSYSALLPSLSITAQLQDDVYLRLGAGRTMRRPDPNDLSLDPADRGGVFVQGNPDLQPEIADSIDLSLEWYPSQLDSLSIAYFHKDLKDSLVDVIRFNEALGRLISQPENDPGTATVDGIELSASHSMTYLPWALDGLGFSGNYTTIDSNQSINFDEVLGQALPVANRSETSYNFQLFWEKYDWSVRFAYVWRDLSLHNSEEQDYRSNSISQIDNGISNLVGETAVLNGSFINPRNWNDEYAQLDFAVGYNFSDTLSVSFKANNITKEKNRRYTLHDYNTRFVNLPSTVYRLNLTWALN